MDKAVTVQMKEAAAEAAAQKLENGMIVGLGSGTTSKLAVDAIGRRIKDGLKITGIPTSESTAAQAEALGIKLATFADYSRIDVAIDGADEVELGSLNLIKGGGGNHLREKIVAIASRRFLVIVDDTKLVSKLGSKAKVPVEVAQFGWQSTAERLKELGTEPELRKAKDGKTLITDGGNFILDCVFAIDDANKLAAHLDSVVGVIEHGLFLNMTSEVLIGTPEGVRTLRP